MSIYKPKKKIIKARSGINTDQALDVAQAGVGMIPGIGTAASAAIGIGRTLLANRKMKKQQEKEDEQRRMGAISDAQADSNKMFGQLTYAEGGELPDNVPSLDGVVQDKAVVLDGKRHKDGGNDVIDSETGEKVAETEAQEMLFTRKQTEQIELLIDEYYEKNDEECLLKLGSLVKRIVENELIDYSGKF